ncbi:MAG: hypothetical protein IT269_08615 [Saprospiraceae bacterium]|nr:hypothetical protein [Saprospiraceae bacterium]
MNTQILKTQTLYRPVNKVELDLIQELDWKAFPPRLPEQPIFYPVMNQEYASQITTEWNLPAYGNGFVTKFQIPSDYLSKYPVYNVGAKIHDELWVPAEDLAEFNSKIIGDIEIVEAHTTAPNSHFLFLEDIVRLSDVAHVLIVHSIHPEMEIKITGKSMLNNILLKAYGRQTEALVVTKNQRANTFALSLDQDDLIARFKKRTVVMLNL